MSTDEKLLIEYLEQFPGIFISPMEVSKRAAGRGRFKAQPEWARPILHRLAQQGDIDCTEFGHYRAKAEGETQAEERQPEMRKPERQPMRPDRDLDEDDQPFASGWRRPGRS